MRQILYLFCLAILAVMTCFPAAAAKGDMAVRKELGTFEEANYDEPFRTTAIIAGRCRDANVPASDTRMIYRLYHLEQSNTNKPKLNLVGIVYFNDKGQESVCFDDLAIEPFVEKNVAGELVSITGWITLGRDYGVNQEKIVIVDSMDLLSEMFKE